MDPCFKFRKKSYIVLIFPFSLSLEMKYSHSQFTSQLRLFLFCSRLGPHDVFFHLQFFSRESVGVMESDHMNLKLLAKCLATYGSC